MTEELVSYDDLPIVSTGLHSNDDSAEPNTLTKPDIRLLKPTISMATDMFLKSKYFSIRSSKSGLIIALYHL